MRMGDNEMIELEKWHCAQNHTGWFPVLLLEMAVQPPVFGCLSHWEHNAGSDGGGNGCGGGNNDAVLIEFFWGWNSQCLQNVCHSAWHIEGA